MKLFHFKTKIKKKIQGSIPKAHETNWLRISLKKPKGGLTRLIVFIYVFTKE